MEQKFNTSFIPKQSLQADTDASASKDRYVSRRTVNGPGFYLTLFILLMSIVVSFGIFGFTIVVEKGIDERIKNLEDTKALFSEANIEMLLRAESHINNAKSTLMGHIAVSGLFEELEDVTLKRVQYMEFLYAGLPGAMSNFTVSGFSENFQDMALQTTQYRVSEFLDDPIVRELERTEVGPVFFSVDVSAFPELTAFSSVIERATNSGSSVTIPAVEDDAPEEVLQTLSEMGISTTSDTQ